MGAQRQARVCPTTSPVPPLQTPSPTATAARTREPQLATVLSASGIERQMTGEAGSKLDVYDLEVGGGGGDTLGSPGDTSVYTW
jgi:hypothetical protein